MVARAPLIFHNRLTAICMRRTPNLFCDRYSQNEKWNSIVSVDKWFHLCRLRPPRVMSSRKWFGSRDAHISMGRAQHQMPNSRAQKWWFIGFPRNSIASPNLNRFLFVPFDGKEKRFIRNSEIKWKRKQEIRRMKANWFAISIHRKQFYHLAIYFVSSPDGDPSPYRIILLGCVYLSPDAGFWCRFMPFHSFLSFRVSLAIAHRLDINISTQTHNGALALPHARNVFIYLFWHTLSTLSRYLFRSFGI